MNIHLIYLSYSVWNALGRRPLCSIIKLYKYIQNVDFMKKTQLRAYILDNLTHLNKMGNVCFISIEKSLTTYQKPLPLILDIL